MSEKSENQGFPVFIIRNVILYFLLFNAYLQVKDQLDLFFVSLVFAFAVIVAIWTYGSRLRFIPAFSIALVLPFLVRLIFFAGFGIQRKLTQGAGADFLYLFFDTDFFPSLVPFYIVWLFNYLAFLNKNFLVAEVFLNSLFLLLVFWKQAHFRITLYPHPVIFAVLIIVFVFLEIFVIVLAEKRRLRSLLSFLWIVVPLAIVLLFFLFNKYSEGAVKTGGGLMKPTFFRFDFSQYIHLESEIELSDDLVLLFRKQGPAKRILLRRFVLSGYSERRGFYRSERDGGPVTVPDSPIYLKDPDYSDRVSVSQEFFFVNFDPSSLIAMNYPVEVLPLKNWDSSSFLRIYRVFSKVSFADRKKLSTFKDLNGTGIYRYYTNYGNDKLIKDLALKVTEGKVSYFDKVLAIRNYLKDNYLYSLKPGIAEDGNQLHHFLFNSKKGYCSYFAFAMALMCRSLGIPARVSVGFFVDPKAEILNFYEVRANQAHAWVEVYFGKYGWIEFDPTSDNLAPGENLRFGSSFDFQSFAGLIEEILKNQNSLKVETGEEPDLKNSIENFGKGLITGIRYMAGLWYLFLPSLYLIFILSAKLRFKVLYIFTDIFTGNPRKKTRYLYCGFLVIIGGHGYVKKPFESHMEFAERIEQEGIRLLTLCKCYLESVFAEEYDDESFKEALHGRQESTLSYRAKYGIVSRIVGFLNPLNSIRGICR